MSDAIEFFCLMLAVFLAVICAISFAMCAWAGGPSRWACSAYGEATGLSVSYQFWGDCYVTMPDGTVLRKGQAEDMLTKKYQSRYQIEVTQPTK